MPSAAAQRYFNSFDPQQQANIRASWGGSDLMDQWFQNAQQAGAVQDTGARKVDDATPGGMTPDKLRQKAKSEGWSEDFARFSDAQLTGWINQYYDPQRGKFRSQHAPPGAGDWAYVEKPTEGIVDPNTGTEWGPHGDKNGVNLSALGLNTLRGSVGGGRGGGQGGGQGIGQMGSPGGFQSISPLQEQLINAIGSQGGLQSSVDRGGGVWSWDTPQDRQALAASAIPNGTVGPVTAPPMGSTQRTAPGGLQDVMTPIQGSAPIPQVGLLGSVLGGGVSQGPVSPPQPLAPLSGSQTTQGMMQKKQKTPAQQGSWFGGGL